MADKPLKANIVSGFAYGYRNREDVSTLKPEVLVSGSQNVLTTVTKRVASRNGYALDGQRDSTQLGKGVYGSFDWDLHIGESRNFRVGLNTTGTNGQLQFRYVASAGDKYLTNTFTEGQVYWITIKDDMPEQVPDFCPFWDFNNELKDLLLFVNGTSNIFMWGGGVATVKAVTANTIQGNFKTGVSWASAGFLSTATYERKVVINGTTYTYTGGEGTDTLTGVTPSPAAEPLQSVVFQKVYTKANGAITGLPATFKNTLIENLNNQIYVSASDNQSVYVSKVNDWTNFSYSTPRLVGEGAVLTLDGVPTCLQQQGSNMFISAGKKWWYETEFVLGSDTSTEALNIIPRKTTELQAAQSQSLTTKIKNLIAFVSFERQVNTFGISANFFTDPQVSDISQSIVNDMNGYDFTGGQVVYHKKFIYVSLPVEGKVLVYNMTLDTTDGLVDEGTHYWEAPMIMPVGRFSIIDGDLYGHDTGKLNTYKMFVGYNDDGYPIKAVAKFAYNTYNDRQATKSSNELYVEGYKPQSTTLYGTLTRDINGSGWQAKWGNLPSRCLITPSDDASIGKESLGKTPIGGSSIFLELPPKFRLVETFPRQPFFEEQVGFWSEGVDQHWELVAYSTNAEVTKEGQNSIRDPNQDIDNTSTMSDVAVLMSGGTDEAIEMSDSEEVIELSGS